MILLGFYKSHALRINVRYRVIGLEVDPHHRPQLQVDEQQQDVVDADPALADHVHEGGHCGIGGDGTDPEQGQVVERLDAQVAQRVGSAVQALAQFFSPFDVHDANSLIRLGRGCGRLMTLCLHAVKRPAASLEKATDCRKTRPPRHRFAKTGL